MAAIAASPLEASKQVLDADMLMEEEGLGGMVDNITLGTELARRLASSARASFSKRAAGRYYAGYAGEAELADKLAAPAPHPLVRQELLDAGLWLPAVVTDAQGKATVIFEMPQKTTQWRITGRGCTVETLVGDSEDKLITRKPFFVDLKLPAVFTEGDQLRPMVQVHNLGSFEGDVEVQITWHTEGPEQDQKTANKTVGVSPKTTADVLFEALTIPAGSMIHFEVSARTGDDKLQDALHKNVPINPWGIELSDTKSRVATGDETLFLELPALPNLTNQQLTIQVAPQVERLILDLALGHYPIIWREGTTRASTISQSRSPAIRPPSDTGSELLAVAAALHYLREVPGTAKDTAALMGRARALVNSLVVRQRENGGWPWSPGSKDADPHVSARGLWALAAAKANGIAVPDTAFEKASVHLQSVFSQTDDDETRAVVIHSLTRAGQGDFSVANRLYRNRQRLNPRAIAATALTFVLLDRNEIAAELVELALQQADLQAMPTDVIALNLLTLQAIQPQSSQVAKLVDALMARRRWGGFHPHEAKGAATTALADYYRQTQFATNDYRLTILVNETVLREVAVSQGQSVIDVETDTLVEGANRVEFRVEGQARYAYRATLTGFLTDIPEKLDEDSSVAKLVQKGKVTRHYYHAPLEYRGRPITESTSEITQLPYGDRTAVSVSLNELPFDVPMVVVESLPAGTTLIPDSVKGNFQYHEVDDGEIRFFLDRYWGASVQRNRSRLPRLSIRYELMSYAPGTYRVLPTRVYYAESPDRRILGEAGDLTVLARGETSSDEYVMNNGERYELGKAYFDDGNYAEALPLLQELRKRDADYHEREVARMLLWISTEPDYFDAPRVVDTFEILRERFPELTIPFDKILVVGKAYREMNEMERGYLVFRSTLNASYANDSHVSAVLQDEGQFLNSVEAQRALWLQYPDTAEVVSSYFALSQALYAQSPQARELAKVKVLPVLEDGEEAETLEDLTSAILLRDTIRMLARFLSLYSQDPLADDATFSLANAYLDLERYEQAVELCGLAQQRYAESEFLSSFQYVQALGLFSQHKFQEAIQAAETVAEGKSKDRDLARYILGQVHHAQGSPDDAIRWYRLVREVYPDAAESISAFEARRIALEEVTRVRPGEPVSLKVKYRNIKEAALQVYRVDLMKLYLREKNLSEITQVRLEGISPQQSTLIPMGDGKDYTDKEKSVTLDLAEEGAYLVICRGDDLFTSGLVLITPMEMEIQEDTVSGRVRVNLTKGIAGEHPEGIHVKVVGSADQRFISGETDLRGIFVADGVRGVATVLARDEQNRYAFHRGTQWIGASTDDDRNGGVERGEAAGVQQQEVDFRENLFFQNKALQGANVERFEELRRGQKRGVEVQKAY